MRDHLAHRYFDTSHAIIAATAQHDLPALANAVTRVATSTGVVAEGSLAGLRADRR